MDSISAIDIISYIMCALIAGPILFLLWQLRPWFFVISGETSPFTL